VVTGKLLQVRKRFRERFAILPVDAEAKILRMG
jgi:hypothetical protein